MRWIKNWCRQLVSKCDCRCGPCSKTRAHAHADLDHRISLICRVLKRRYERAFIAGQNEVAHLVGLIGLDDLLHPRLASILFPNGDQAGVWPVRILYQDGVPTGIQAGLDRIVGIDGGRIEIIECARQLRRVDLGELEMLRITGDIARCRIDACDRVDPGAQFDRPRFLQQQ